MCSLPSFSPFLTMFSNVISSEREREREREGGGGERQVGSFTRHIKHTHYIHREEIQKNRIVEWSTEKMFQESLIKYEELYLHCNIR